MYRTATELNQILNFFFICKTEEHIDMKLSLKVYLNGVLNIMKEKLCDGISLRFVILMTSHETQL